MLTGRWLRLAVLTAFAAAASPGVADERRAVRIATEGAFPPFNFVERGEPQGFEVELGKALCEAGKLACTFVTHEWEGIVKGLLARQYDAIMSSLVVTERRKARIAFTKRYYRMPASFIARKDAAPAGILPRDLAGKTIGTAERADFAAYLERTYPETQVRVFGKLEEANLDLLTERVDVVFGDKLALSRFLASREGGCCRIVADAPADAPILGEGIAIGLRKDEAELKDLFDRAIDQVTRDGTYDRIRAKYFPFDIR